MKQIERRIRNHAMRVAFLGLFHPRTDVQMDRLGTAYGGWWIPQHGFDSESICYLAGVGTDISFDVALMERFSCKAWGFDPTPKSIQWVAEQSLDSRYTFVPVGLADAGGKARFYAPRNPDHVSHSAKNLQNTTTFVEADVLSVRGMMEMLGHDHISLLKLDIEGAEHDTIRAMLDDGVYPDVICVEFDQPEPLTWARRTVSSLRGAGYELLKIDGFNLTFSRTR